MPAAPKKATVHCASCPKKANLFCSACAGRAHNVSTKTQHHSLEAIDPNQNRSFFVLAPLFDFLVLPTLLLYTVLKVGVPANYMTGRDVCPMTHFVRREMYHFDSGMTYLIKDKLAWVCNLEDGYFRLIIDTWVRAISTDTDSYLLLYSAVVRALVFHAVAIRLFVLPALVLLNSILTTIFYVALKIAARLHYNMPAILPEGLRTTLCSLAAVLQAICDLVVDPGDSPPPTLPRLRPRTDYLDGYKYWKGRHTRVWDYFYDGSKARLRVLTLAIPVMAVAIRALCITTSFDSTARRLSGLSNVVAQAASEVVPGDALGHAIDKIVHELLARAISYLPLAISFIPVSSIICFSLLYAVFKYPGFKNWLDTRNWYGAQCGKANYYNVTGKCRWFPTTFEPPVAQ